MGVRLRPMHAVCLAALALSITLTRPVQATPSEVGGGGSSKTDCLTTFVAEVNTPASKPRHVKCMDGDGSCDSDLVVNGVCNVKVRVCVDSTFSPKCTLNGVDSVVVSHAEDDGIDTKFDPDFQALKNRIEDEGDIDISQPAGLQTSNQCSDESTISVPIKGPVGSKDSCSTGKKKVKLTTLSKPISGKIYKDVDSMTIKCVPATCDPTLLFDGTFDRIQRQIYDQSCAVSTCHDSQTQQKELLLEAGASYNNTAGVPPNDFGVDPSTAAALGAGWKRIKLITPGTVGDPEASFIYRKIKGTLPDATYGVRMPYKRKKLHSSLVEIVRLWILNGAPTTPHYWVPGTD